MDHVPPPLSPEDERKVRADADRKLSELLQRGDAPREWIDAAKALETRTSSSPRFWTQIGAARDAGDVKRECARLRKLWGDEFQYRSDMVTLWLGLHPLAWADLDHVRLPPESGDHFREWGHLLMWEPGMAEWMYAQALKLTSHEHFKQNPSALRAWANWALDYRPYYGSNAAHSDLSLRVGNAQEAIDNLGLNILTASKAVKNIGEGMRK